MLLALWSDFWTWTRYDAAIAGTPYAGAAIAGDTRLAVGPDRGHEYGGLRWMYPVLQAWQPPDPVPQFARNLSPGIPGFSVDNPRPNANALINLGVIRRSW